MPFQLIVKVLAVTSMVLLPTVGQSEDSKSYLDQFKWKNRLIILVAPSFDNPSLAEQKRRLQGEVAGLSERDLKVIEVIGAVEGRIGSLALSPEQTVSIRKALQLTSESFGILLVGKDGTVKLRSKDVVTNSQLFSLIDSMPMRKLEMETRNSEKPPGL